MTTPADVIQEEPRTHKKTPRSTENLLGRAKNPNQRQRVPRLPNERAPREGILSLTSC